MALDISFEYLSSIADKEELNDIKKIIRLEKGQLSSLENQVMRVEQRLKIDMEAKKEANTLLNLNNSS